MLGCRFSIAANVKSVREKATEYLLKTTEVLLDADGYVLTPTFDIYQGTVAPNCLMCANSKLLISLFFSKKVLSEVRSEIQLFQRNIVSTGQSVRV